MPRWSTSGELTIPSPGGRAAAGPGSKRGAREPGSCHHDHSCPCDRRHIHLFKRCFYVADTKCVCLQSSRAPVLAPRGALAGARSRDARDRSRTNTKSLRPGAGDRHTWCMLHPHATFADQDHLRTHASWHGGTRARARANACYASSHHVRVHTRVPRGYVAARRRQDSLELQRDTSHTCTVEPYASSWG